MIRRPPTVISLTEDDVNFHMQRIFARSSTAIAADIGRLDLEDPDKSADAMHQDQPNQTPSPESGTKPQGRDTQPSQGPRSDKRNSTMTASASTGIRTPLASTTVRPASTMRGVTHRASAANFVNSSGASMVDAAAAHLVSFYSSQTNTPTPTTRTREASPASPQRMRLTIPPQEFLERRITLSPSKKKVDRLKLTNEDSLTQIIVIADATLEILQDSI
ncbi:hypothetical protein N7539_001695 [Penicillium diatomitis]|uniref:Uncharacterized protein n=1 Tax=Penicillium diatomitis TaxID=2819901 RepID=A0A9W9XIF5_9EURO|nr:uncharacterized protein N7539_001695 [Penicillium diatomitis]KAJ5492949.1 hypothetical protein N7539_001695 [Penicillium diatomitis]